MVKFNEDDQKARVSRLREQEEEELARILSQRYGLQYVDLTSVPINTDALRVIKEDIAREHMVAGFNLVGKKMDIAAVSPNKNGVSQILEELEKQGYTVTVFMASRRSLEFAWDRYKDLSHASRSKRGSLDISGEEIQEFLQKVEGLADTKREIENVLSGNRSYRTSRIMEIFLAGAIATESSDLHIEPEEEKVRLRFRLDGILTDVIEFDKDTYNLLLSRVKLLSGLKLNIKKQAQDGRLSVMLGDSEVEIRTSILPSEYGESIVLRVLNPNTSIRSLDDLGLGIDIRPIIESAIGQPNGMILTTGPTGSGKTTALYAFIRTVYRPEIKIITIEDPIEYHFAGIVQTQINEKKGYSFSEGLRSILRQDPDVIMVGEIRDDDTATTAVQAALTGHLVFSTLHTNSAAGAFPRLINLGVDPKVMGSAVRVAMAQRLVRTLCKKCAKEVPLEGGKMEFVEKTLAGARSEARLAETPNRSSTWEAVGCPECSDSGYLGRVGIYEAIQMDNAVEEIIRMNPTEHEIHEASSNQHILTMEQDGVLKALAGITSLDELMRIVGSKD